MGTGARIGDNGGVDSDLIDALRLDLASCPLFEGLSTDEFGRLLGLGSVRDLAGGDSVVEHGAHGNELMVVIEGRCDVRNGLNDLIAVLEKGALLGEVGFIDGQGRSATVSASGVAKVLVFEEDLLQRLEDVPVLQIRLLRNLARILCKKLRYTTRLAQAGFV